MMIKLEMGKDFSRTLTELGGMGAVVAEACSKGLAKGTKVIAGKVAADYLSGQSLKRRTGNLARAVEGWMHAPLEGVIGVRDDAAVSKYKWILGDEDKTIRPRNGKFLAIPIGENLTGRGVARWSSPRDVPDGFFVRAGGKLFFGYKKGTTGRGKFRALFVLVKSVFVQGSGALPDGVLENIDDINDEINKELDKRMET